MKLLNDEFLQTRRDAMANEIVDKTCVQLRSLIREQAWLQVRNQIDIQVILPVRKEL